MRRLLDLRIVRWELKLAYAVGAWFIGYPIVAVLQWLGTPDNIVGLVAGSLLNIAAILLGARIFRGKGEPVEPARPLWQMTARPTLSRRVGVIAAVGAALSSPLIVIAALGPAYTGNLRPYSLFSTIETVVFLAFIAFLYLNSAARLKAAGVGPLEREFKPKAPVKLS